MQKMMRKVLQSVKPTARCGALDDDKKAMVIVLIGQGASRREAAALVKCHHTTIGRTAARDGAFAAKLSQVEAAAHLEAGDMIRRAASDPKYWRAAAWMLERRNPEDYAKRDPTTFTGDQVTTLMASFCHEVQKLVPQDKAAELEKLFDDVLDEIEAKSGPVKREEASKEAEKESKPLASQEPSRNGYHTTNGALHAAPVLSNGKAHEDNGESPETALRPHPDPLPDGDEDDFEPLLDGEGEEDLEPAEAIDEDDIADDDAVPPELARRRKELDAELAAHLGGYAVAPPSRAAREVLREFHRQFVHHPRHRVDAAAAAAALRKVFSVNDLQQQSAACTTAPNTEGRCNKEVVQSHEQ
jgi:hypothetical protein